MGNYVSALYGTNFTTQTLRRACLRSSDFQTVLKLDPNCKEARDAIDAIGGPNVTKNGLRQVGPHLHFPHPDDPLSEAETVSCTDLRFTPKRAHH